MSPKAWINSTSVLQYGIWFEARVVGVENQPAIKSTLREAHPTQATLLNRLFRAKQWTTGPSTLARER
jgi:hypothetical protein